MTRSPGPQTRGGTQTPLEDSRELALRFLATKGWDDSRKFLDDHPELLDPRVDAALAELGHEAEAEGNAKDAAAVALRRTLLKACRERGSDLGFLDTVQSFWEDSLAQASNDDPDRLEVRAYLGAVLRSRYEYSGEVTDLDRAIDNARAWAEESEGRPAGGRALDELAHLLATRFERVREMGDLFQSLDMQAAAVAATDQDAVEFVGRQYDLAQMALRQVEVLRPLLDEPSARRLLELAVDAARRALAASDSEGRLQCLIGLTRVLRARYTLFGDLTDLDAGIEAYEESAELMQLGSRARAGGLNDLSLAVEERYKRTGHITDLQRAVTALEASLAATPLDVSEREGQVARLEGLIRRQLDWSAGR